MRGGVGSWRLASSIYKSFLHTTTAPPLSADLIIKSELDLRDLMAKRCFLERLRRWVVLACRWGSISLRHWLINLSSVLLAPGAGVQPDSHSYLRFQSSHPPACKKGIPFSQLLRAKRICSDPKDFDRVCEDMTGFFHERGYPREITQSAQDRVKCLDRASSLQPSNPKSSERVPLVLTYHPLNLPIRKYHLQTFPLAS